MFRRSQLIVLIAVLALGCSGTTTPSNATPAAGTTAATGSPAASQTLDDVEAAQADVRSFVKAIERGHPDLFGQMSEEEWRSAIDRLDALIPQVVHDAPERLMVEVMRLAMLPGLRDGRHGHMVVFTEDAADRPLLGLATYVFADGVYVTSALPPHEGLAGARIVAIAGVPIDEVRKLIDPLLPRDNEWTPEMHLPSYLIRPEVLVGLGITSKVGPTAMTVETQEGQQLTVEIELVPPGDMEQFRVFTTFRLPERAGAEWTNRADDPFWWETLHDGRTIFAQQNVVRSVPESVLVAVRAAASKPRVERVVLDLRHNVGGDYSSLSTTLEDASIDQPDRLFVITSTNTFSGASALVTELDLGTHAVVVGEPMGGAPNFYGFDYTITLDGLPIPLEIPIPTGAEESDPGSQRLTIEPQIRVPLEAADYFDGRDSALEAILQHTGT